MKTINFSQKLTIIFLVLTILVGCMPSEYGLREKVNTPFENLLFLEEGVSKEQIINRLGHPFNCYNGGKIFTYLMYEDVQNGSNKLYDISEVKFEELGDNIYIKDYLNWYALVLVFDEGKEVLEKQSTIKVRAWTHFYEDDTYFRFGESMVHIWAIEIDQPNFRRCENLK